MLANFLNRRIVRYAIVGVFGCSIDIAIFLTLTYYTSLPWLLSSFISLFIATLVGYYLSIMFVFRSEVRFKRNYEILFVLSIAVFAFSLHHIALYLLVEVVGLRLLSAKVLVIGLLFFFNYLSRSRIVFRGPREADGIG